MTDATPLDDKDNASTTRARRVITPPDSIQASFTSRYKKPDSEDSATSKDLTEQPPSEKIPPSADKTQAAIDSIISKAGFNVTATSRPNPVPPPMSRPTTDKVGEDLKKWLAALAKYTSTSENGLAFMPLTRTLADIQHQKERGALAFSIVFLDTVSFSAVSAQNDFLELTKDATPESWFWECGAQTHNNRPFWLRPNNVKPLTLPNSLLSGHRVILIPPNATLNAVELGYIEHFSDILIILGSEKAFSEFNDNQLGVLSILMQMATVTCPWLLVDTTKEISSEKRQSIEARLYSGMRSGLAKDKQSTMATVKLGTLNSSEISTALFQLAGFPDDGHYSALWQMIINRGCARRAGVIANIMQNAVKHQVIKLDQQIAQTQNRQELFSYSVNTTGQKNALSRIQTDMLAELDEFKERLETQARDELANKRALALQIITALEGINYPLSFEANIKPNYLNSIGLGNLGRIFGNNTVLLSLGKKPSETLRNSFKALINKLLVDRGRELDKDLKCLIQYYQNRLEDETGRKETLSFNFNLDKNRLEKFLNDHIASQLDNTTATYQVKFERKGVLAHISKARMAVSSILMIGALIMSALEFQKGMKETAIVTAVAIGCVLLINVLLGPSQERHAKQEHLNDLIEKLSKLLNDIVHKVVGQYCGLYKQQVDQEQKRIKQQFDTWIRREDETKGLRQADLELINKQKKELDNQRRAAMETLQSSLSKPGISQLAQDLDGLSIHLAREIGRLAINT